MISKDNTDEGFYDPSKGEEIFMGVVGSDLNEIRTGNTPDEDEGPLFLGVVGLNLTQDQIQDEKRTQLDSTEQATPRSQEASFKDQGADS